MRKTARVLPGIALAVLLTACTSNSGEAPQSQTPIDINVSAEYNADNLGGAIQWTVTGGEGAIPDDTSILVSIGQSGAELASPGAEYSERTAAFAERVGEAGGGGQIISSTNSSTGEIRFTMRQTDAQATVQAPRVHVALMDDASGNAVAVRSVPVDLIDLSGGPR